MQKFTELVSAVMESATTTTRDNQEKRLDILHEVREGTYLLTYGHETVNGILAAWTPETHELYVREQPASHWSAALSATVREIGVLQVLHSLQLRYGGELTNGICTIHAENFPHQWK